MTEPNNPGEQGSAEAPSVPSSLDKFRNDDGTIDAERLGKSYVELEKMTTQNRQAPKGKDPLIPDPRSDGPLSLDAFNPFFQEYAENGDLTEESWTKAERMSGMDKESILRLSDLVNKGQTFETQQAYEPFGGKDAIDEARAWAQGALSDEKIAEINEDFEAGGRLGERALEDLMESYRKATGGSESINPKGGNRAPTGSGGFTSKAEMDAAFLEAKQSKSFEGYMARLTATKSPATLK